MSDFNPYHQWLGISETERPISKYRLLSIDEFESDRDVISAAAERQTVYLRMLQAGEHASLVADLLNEVSQARVTLLNADQKAAYDEQLRKQQAPEPVPEPTPLPILVSPGPESRQSPVVVRKSVTTDNPRLTVQPVRRPRRRKQREIWKQPAVIGVSVVGAIGVLVLFISIVSYGDAENTQRRMVPVWSVADEPEGEMDDATARKAELAAAREVNLVEMKKEAEKSAQEILARDTIYNFGMKLKFIPAGTFLMGSPESETGRDSNESQHEVTISNAFYMQTTEVTQRQWMSVMGTKPWNGKANVKEGPNYAATFVSWADAVAYGEKLSERDGKTYRLPTEAEWEYACRAGTETAWSFGDDAASLVDYAWYRENTSNIDKFAHEVQLKKPNAFGLYDMHGNVWEWCHDYYKVDYYKGSPKQDPQGPAAGSSYVFRGGSWFDLTLRTRSTFRNSNTRGFSNVDLGFRVVRELD